jgi:aminoglycoside phosphotransferase family enzyme/predicted kinase
MGQAMATNQQVIEPYSALHETHTGLVVLVGDLAYKAKKPVRTDFLDFSTPQRRDRACQCELELNRRLAPDSYLGVAHLSTPWNGTTEPVLVMRRHPDWSRLATMVARGQPITEQLVTIAEMLAGFHKTAGRGQHVEAQGTVAAVKARWEANIAELWQSADTVVEPRCVEAVAQLVARFLAGRAALFTGRITDRRIVDGHGDLLADDIFCLPAGPQILDCLEFDENLRYVDTIDDAAFLAMDLEFLGRKDLGDFFLDQYSRLATDPAPQSLKHFYIAYRAVVRGKVDCVRFAQGHRDAAADASRHLAIALEHLRACSVRLAVVGGGPGTGKTTLAHGLAQRVGAEVVSTDEVRRALQDAGAVGGVAGVLNAGLYSDKNVAAVYDEVIRRARDHLVNGRSVILDGTWRDSHRRDQVRQLAVQTHSAEIDLRCETSVKSAAHRVATRSAGNMSDATPAIACALADDTQEWQKWFGAHPIDTSRPPSESVRAAEELWRLAVEHAA